MRRLLTLINLSFLCLAACVSLPPEPAARSNETPPPLFPTRIAVLPVFNRGASADGARMVRAFALRKVDRQLGYFVQRAEETDQVLASRTLGETPPPGRDPLEKFKPALVASWLGVEGLLYGELLSFSKTSIEFYHQVKIRVHFWLVDASGKKIWEDRQDVDGGGFASGAIPLDAVLVDGSMAPDVQDIIRRSDLAEVTYQVVEASLASFPPRR